MESLPFKIVDNDKRGVLLMKKEFFERECILQVSSEYSSSYFVSFYPISHDSLEITIKSKDNTAIDETLLRSFFNDCIDQQIRIDLQKEFGELRNKIVEYAFFPVEKTHD